MDEIFIQSFFEEPMASRLVTLRRKARRLKGHRLTYDCMNAVVVGGVVKCGVGHKFKGVGNRADGGMGLLAVLRGRASGRCQKCNRYDEETTE